MSTTHTTIPSEPEYLTLGEVSAYLGWSTRFVEALLHGEKLPGTEQGGTWKFRREDLIEWLDTKIQSLHARRIDGIDGPGILPATPEATGELPLPEQAIVLNAEAENPGEVLGLLSQLGHLLEPRIDPSLLLQSLRDREALCSTALPGGLAICHPRHPFTLERTEPLIAFVRTKNDIAFGSDDGTPTSLFFLLVAHDDKSHLNGLSKLARILTPATLAKLKKANNSGIAKSILQEAARNLVVRQS